MSKNRCEITFEPSYRPATNHPFWTWINRYVIEEIDGGILVEFDQDPGIGLMINNHFYLMGYHLNFLWAQKEA